MSGAEPGAGQDRLIEEPSPSGATAYTRRIRSVPLTDTVTTVEQLGISWHDFDVRAADFADLKQAIYDHRVVVLRNQQDMTPEEFIALGRGLGTIVPYYQPMYHHPEHSEIFVSSNVPVDGQRVGVPKTGRR